MGKGMKVFRAFLLAVLVVICIAAVVVIFLQLNKNSNPGETLLDTNGSGSGVRVDSDNIRPTVHENHQLGQRAAVKPDDSEYWHFYPMFPADVMPGDTVVLSACADGFVDWEVDSNYADVKLIDQSSDSDNVYVSFVMPDEEVAIRALYEDIPYGNFESFVSSNKDVEHGEFTTLDAANVFTGTVGVSFSEFVELPVDIFIDYPLLTWSIDPIFDDLPPGLSLTRVGDNLRIAGTPTVSDFYEVYILLEDAGTTIDIIECRFTIYDAPPDPDIEPHDIPDALQGVFYQVELFAIDLPELLNPTINPWVWVDSTVLNSHGLSINVDDGRAFIRGTPTVAGVVTFSAILRTDEPGAMYDDVVRTYTITIWEPPIITESGLTDGMVGVPYNAAFATTGGTGALGATNWTWSIDGNSLLAYGLDIDPLTGALSGTPLSAALPGHDFTVRYTPDQSDIYGSVTKLDMYGDEDPFTVTLWPRPVITTGSRLSDGMAGPPNPALEPPEDDYSTMIEAERFPDGTEWVWTVSAGLPAFLDPDPVWSTANVPDSNDKIKVELSGYVPPASENNYTFTVYLAPAASVSNPNINNPAAQEQETFDLRIWPRTYLYVNTANKSYVSRVGEKNAADIGIEWTTWPPVDTPATMLYRDRRAVMPGTKGVISIDTFGVGFVRWEVETGHPTSNSVVIGGGRHGAPDIGNWGHRGQNSYVEILMPAVINAALPFTANRDVYIQGFSQPELKVEASLSVGTVGDSTYSSTIYVNGDLGSGPITLNWDIVNGPLPTNLMILASNNFTTSLIVMPGRQIGEPSGLFPITIGVNLPGTMRIDGDFTILINPTPGILIGDVTGKDGVNLADLIMLSMYIAEEPGVVLNNPQAAFIVPPFGAKPTHLDLGALARYFANPEENPYNISTVR